MNREIVRNALTEGMDRLRLSISQRDAEAVAAIMADRLEHHLIDALHDAEVALDQARQLASLRQVRIRDLELQMDEAAQECERNSAELLALRDALVPLIRAAEAASAA